VLTEISNAADVLVLCGDLTNFGRASEAEILAEDSRTRAIPVLGVPGDHDHECGSRNGSARFFARRA
jgi:Icc-related predicted phosphoesterase